MMDGPEVFSSPVFFGTAGLKNRGHKDRLNWHGN